jgi:hypothetical protein
MGVSVGVALETCVAAGAAVLAVAGEVMAAGPRQAARVKINSELAIRDILFILLISFNLYLVYFLSFTAGRTRTFLDLKVASL